jgi:hypothetical protein
MCVEGNTTRVPSIAHFSISSPYNRPRRPKRGAEVQIYFFFKLGTRWGWMFNATPWPLYPRKRAGTHCTGGWVGLTAGLDGCGQSHPYRDSIPDRPAHSESLYRLSLRGPCPFQYPTTNLFFNFFFTNHLWQNTGQGNKTIWRNMREKADIYGGKMWKKEKGKRWRSKTGFRVSLD